MNRLDLCIYNTHPPCRPQRNVALRVQVVVSKRLGAVVPDPERHSTLLNEHLRFGCHKDARGDCFETLPSEDEQLAFTVLTEVLRRRSNVVVHLVASARIHRRIKPPPVHSRAQVFDEATTLVQVVDSLVRRTIVATALYCALVVVEPALQMNRVLRWRNEKKLRHSIGC